MLRKIPVLWKKASSKSCLEVNSQQKSKWLHMSMSPGVELEDSNDRYGLNIIMYKNNKLHSI